MRKTWVEQVPASYIRKQTLTGVERYITEELKAYEAKALSGEERIKELENSIAELDMLLAFADVAAERGYCCQEVYEGDEIVITAGRHPVVEREVKAGFVPNDIRICTNDRLMIRIFTRVGAYDDLSMGQSSFMVEMSETANILNNATERSLIILDEIGRGTSTLDGVSIAWSVGEYVNERIRAKTLFATHFYELTELA